MLFDPSKILSDVNEKAIENDGLLQLIDVFQNQRAIQESRRQHVEQINIMAQQVELAGETNKLLRAQITIQANHAHIAEQTLEILAEKEERELGAIRKTKVFRTILNHAKELLGTLEAKYPVRNS
jgi:hypothetical protein